MAEITLDTDRYDTFGVAPIHFSKAADGETIQKVMGLEIPQHNVLARPLTGRVTPKDSIAAVLEKQLEQLSPEEFDQLEDALVENPDKGANYIVRLQALIAAILAQLQQLSEKDKDKISTLEKEYKVDTLWATDAQRSLGWSGLAFGGLRLGLSLLQMSGDDLDEAIFKPLVDHGCPGIQSIWDSRLQAKQTSAGNSASLKLNKYQMLTNAEQNKSSDKQQVSGIFDKALRNLESASRSG